MEKNDKVCDQYIKVSELKERMYTAAFLTDSDLQKWDSGCWIRYKLFENVLADIQPAEVVSIEQYANLLANAIIVSNALKEYRAEDFVKVVRCKDCQFWKTETEPLGIECEPGEAAHYCHLSGMITRTDDFCNYGGRRTNEESPERTD